MWAILSTLLYIDLFSSAVNSKNDPYDPYRPSEVGKIKRRSKIQSQRLAGGQLCHTSTEIAGPSLTFLIFETFCQGEQISDRRIDRVP
jgi:hypothetical protein